MKFSNKGLLLKFIKAKINGFLLYNLIFTKKIKSSFSLIFLIDLGV